jgi:hypothetical protein
MGALQIVGMNGIAPVLLQPRTVREEARILVETSIAVIKNPVGTGGPNDVRDEVGERSERLLAENSSGRGGFRS